MLDRGFIFVLNEVLIHANNCDCVYTNFSFKRHKNSEYRFVIQIQNNLFKLTSWNSFRFFKLSMLKLKIRNLTCSFSFYFQNQACQNQKFKIWHALFHFIFKIKHVKIENLKSDMLYFIFSRNQACQNQKIQIWHARFFSIYNCAIFDICSFIVFYIRLWNVLEITSSCCSFVNLIKFTA